MTAILASGNREMSLKRNRDLGILGTEMSKENQAISLAHLIKVGNMLKLKLNMLKFFTYKLDRSILTSLYNSIIRPLVEYGDVIWNNCYD